MPRCTTSHTISPSGAIISRASTRRPFRLFLHRQFNARISFPRASPAFVDALDMRRVAEIRLADAFANGAEVHLKTGCRRSRFFADMFRRVRGAKASPATTTNAFGSLDDMLSAAATIFVRQAGSAG